MFSEGENKSYDAVIKKFVDHHYNPNNRLASKYRNRIGNMLPSIEEEKDSPETSFAIVESDEEAD